MVTQDYTLAQFADLLRTENQRGIINGPDLFAVLLSKGIPKIIRDVRGAVRMNVERSAQGVRVTRYATPVAQASRRVIR